MTAKDFADIASALAWPLTAILFLSIFYKPVRILLERLATTLTIKTVKLKAFGAEVELTPEQAKRALDELLQDIADSTNELSSEESSLFESILHAGGRMTVTDLFRTFARDSKEHQQLRKLRDRKLVRPFEGGRWQPDKHPVPSRFGQLVYDLKNSPKNAA
jgi:polyhydroxyalkanoate synthesis regulator phasin